MPRSSLFVDRRRAAARDLVAASGEKDAPSAAPGEKVIIVEDRDDVRQSTFTLFRELGYEVHAASNSDEALQILDKQPNIALVFTDIVIPGMNRREFAKAVAASYPSTRVLMTTGQDRSFAGSGGAEGGDFPFLATPFTLAELARKVREFSMRPAAGQTVA